MESALIRGFVILLALGGFGASSYGTHVSRAHGSAPIVSSPAPLCAPNSGNTCGMQ
jgi:hypothetical protein